MQTQTHYSAIGLMSGTSHDGVDIAHCSFELLDGSWNYRFLETEFVPFTSEWRDRLLAAPSYSALKYAQLHTEFGRFLGQITSAFIERNQLKAVDVVASHGHTIFHQPETGFTSQIGEGAALAVECGFPVACDFRTLDVALGGQGAPLVPIGDQLLFGNYAACLNIGGFANISFENEGHRIAFDVCPANFLLNPLAEQLGKPFDNGGALARQGSVLSPLLDRLNAIPYYNLSPPKSLGRENAEAEYFPLLNQQPTMDEIATVTEHIAQQIAASLPANGTTLCTGGGALNTFLIERIGHHCNATIQVGNTELLEFKEALIFAFLGVLRLRGQNNTLSSVTGSSSNSCGGALYTP